MKKKSSWCDENVMKRQKKIKKKSKKKNNNNNGKNSNKTKIKKIEDGKRETKNRTKKGHLSVQHKKKQTA